MNILTELSDHTIRSVRALAGFPVFGGRWLKLWVFYLFSPLLRRILSAQEWSLGLCRIRTREGDAYTFANLFEDYPADTIRKALLTVDLVIDAGANVGAFSLLATHLLAESGRSLKVIAIEPMPENAAMLRTQPFASKLEVLEGALGTENGSVSMQRGFNSVTHQADFANQNGGNRVAMFGLADLCDQITLLKMDIEGGEHAVLAEGLPSLVKYMFLEWHPVSGKNSETGPGSLVTHGRWHLVSRDLYGSSMWFWEA